MNYHKKGAGRKETHSRARRNTVGITFKRSALTHDQVPKYYSQELLQTMPPLL